MSMMSETLLPSACEVDVTGLLAMYILQLASGTPSALLDWNNNYEQDPDKCVLFHCSNVAKSFFASDKMDYQEIIAGSVGKENTYGTIVGRIKASPATFCRTMTDDVDGVIRAYVGEGQFTDDALETFGGYGVMQIENLQTLLSYICRMGFEHHVAVSLSADRRRHRRGPGQLPGLGRVPACIDCGCIAGGVEWQPRGDLSTGQSTDMPYANASEIWLTRHQKNRSNTACRQAPSVLLFVETSREFGRGLLHGIARYSRLHGPWRVYRWPGRWIRRCRSGST